MPASSRSVIRAFTRRSFSLAGVAVLALALAGCFGQESEQRAAFITFLQNRIINKPGLHIPILSSKETEDLGPYGDQYRILNGFHHAIDASISADVTRVLQIGNPRSLAELMDRRAIIPLLKTGMAKFRTAIDSAEANADAAHAALKQPADLKAVYDVAYDRMVTQPAKVFRELAAMTETMLPPVEQLADFLNEHRSVIDFQDNTPVTQDPAVRAQLAVLMQAAAKSAQASEEGKRRLRAMVDGH